MAALGHDLYHPGVNQHFLHRTQHFLSGLYEVTNVLLVWRQLGENDVVFLFQFQSSVLENHHWRCFISLLKESHVFDHFSSNRW